MGLTREGLRQLGTTVRALVLMSISKMEMHISLRSTLWIGTAQRERKPFKSWMRTPARCWIRGAFPASPMGYTWFGTFPGTQKSTSLGRRGTMPWSEGRFSDRRATDREHPFGKGNARRVITLQP